MGCWEAKSKISLARRGSVWDAMSFWTRAGEPIRVLELGFWGVVVGWLEDVEKRKEVVGVLEGKINGLKRFIIIEWLLRTSIH